MIQSIDLNRIHDFLRVVELGNITRAAEALGERKAKLSRNLALLEKELGVQLVYRTTRQFKLTQAGTEFYQQMKETYLNLESAIAQITKKDEAVEGRIRITAPEDLGNHVITSIVNEFCNSYPRVEFDFIYTNQMLDLVKLGIDVAFRIGHLKDSSLLHKKAGSIDFILAASPSYLDKAEKISSPQDLVHHSTVGFLVMGAANSNKYVWPLHSQAAKQTVRVKPRLVANNFLTVRDLILRGRGVAFLPRFLVQKQIDNGDLVHVLRHWRNEGLPVQVAMPAQKKVAERIRRFFDYSVRHLGETL